MLICEVPPTAPTLEMASVPALMFVAPVHVPAVPFRVTMPVPFLVTTWAAPEAVIFGLMINSPLPPPPLLKVQLRAVVLASPHMAPVPFTVIVPLPVQLKFSLLAPLLLLDSVAIEMP